MKEKIISNKTIQRFENHLKMTEKAQNTIDKYLHNANNFAKYLHGRNVNQKLAIAYKQYLQNHNYAVTSINSAIASLNCLFIFMGLSDCRLKSLKLQPRTYCPENEELTKKEYVRLVYAAKQIGNEKLSLIIQTICGTGIRVSELQFITVKAIQRGEATVSLKGKTRQILIVKDLRKKLLHYIEKQKITDGIIFRTRTGKPISRTNIWRAMKNLCKQARVNTDKVFPHNLRHLFARTFYRTEKDIAKLANLLGHSNINTTRIYVITTSDEHRRCLENMRLII